MKMPVIYSFVLSQIFGLFMLIIGLMMLAHARYYQNLFKDFFKALKPNELIIFFSALFSLFLGIILVDTHNIWTLKPAIYITIVSWLIFVNALCWLYMPVRMFNLWKKILTGRGYYYVDVILIILGFGFIAAGFETYLFGGGNFLFLRFF